jgi:hypothetical protein
MLFHNGRPAAKFNDSEYTLEMFSRFITKYTGMKSFVSVIILTLWVSSSDSKATGCKLNGQGLIPGWYSTFFFFFCKHIQYGSGEPSTLLSSKYQRLCFQEQRQPEHLANNLPQPPIQWALRTLSPWMKWPECEAGHSLLSTTKIENECNLYLYHINA